MTSASHEPCERPKGRPLGIKGFKVVIYSIHKEEVYTRALHAVEAIDADLTSGRRHYRSRGGRLLTRLDEVVRAILDNELAGAEPVWLAEAA